MRTRRLYRFGPFQLDATAKVLLREGRPVRLARKAVETLLVLVENAGQVLTKEELMAAVWPDRVVDEANLAQNIAVIRKALAVERDAPGYIETFPGRGYRILGPIGLCEDSAGPPPPELAARPPSRRWRIPVISAAVALPALIGVWAWRRTTSPEAAQLPQREPVARQAGKEYQPVVSPDGVRVAFVWENEDGRRSGVWVREAMERPPRRVTREAGDYSSPAWSPDGRRLAYLRLGEPQGAILVASLEDRSERVVSRVFPSRYGLASRHLDWSPDGAWLALDDADSPHEPLSIFLVSPASGERRRLTQPDTAIIGDVDPRFSPDGRTLSFVRAFHRAHQELFAVPLSGGAPRQLTSDGAQISGQDWMPGGRTLVFGSNRSGEFRLWKLAYPPSAKGVLPTGVYGDFPIQFSLARRAPVLVYSVLQHDLNIWRLELEAPPAQRWKRVIASSGQDASPQYSPDGRRICFRSDRSGEEQLWIADVEGGDALQLTRGALRPSVGRWSPDGRAIVFNNARTGEIYLASQDAAGQWTVQPTGATGYHPVFSPDGRWIYAGTMNSIVRFPAGGGTPEPVAPTKGISLGVSPDGRYLYFVREPADTALWRVETASGRLSKVLDGLLPYCSSCWALTERGIYYLGTAPGRPDRQILYLRELVTGRDQAVLEYPEPLSPLGSGPFSLSPDGRYLLCVRVDPSNSDVFRVQPFH